jgi:hypothetical protein
MSAMSQTGYGPRNISDQAVCIDNRSLSCQADRGTPAPRRPSGWLRMKPGLGALGLSGAVGFWEPRAVIGVRPLRRKRADRGCVLPRCLGGVDPTARHPCQRQLYDQRSSAFRPRLRRLPDIEQKQGLFVQGPGISHDKNAPTRLKELVDLINLERNGIIEQLVRCLRIDARAECQRFADQRVVHWHDARPDVSAVSETADVGRAEQATTLLAVKGLEVPTPVEQ